MKRFAATVAAACVLSSPLNGYAQAGEVFAGPLALLRTYVKTAGPVGFDNVPVEALTVTTANCPTAVGCTLRIELSSQFSAVPEGNVAAVLVNVDGAADGINPVASIGFDSTSTGGASNVRTFSWMKKVSTGNHQVRVWLFLASPGGSAGSFSRTLTIDVYKP